MIDLTGIHKTYPGAEPLHAKIILADEPAGTLDSRTAQDIMDLLTLSGFFDTDAYGDAMRDMQPLLDNAGRNIVVDCTRLAYVSSSALRAFLLLREKSRASGGRITIHGMRDDVKQVFIISGFLGLFDFE